MHHASHILMHCIAFWCLINGGRTARHAVSPDILANFAKNIASVLSPAILGDIQFRTNRSILKSSLNVPTNLNDEDLDSPSILDNIVDNTSNAPTYYGAQSYNNLYENSPEEFQGNPEVNEPLEGSLRDEPYLRQQQPNFYRPYDFSANSDNLEVTEKPDIEPSLGNIEGSATNLYSSYHDTGFDKAAFAQGPFGPKSLAGFHGFGHYGDFHGHHHHHHHHHPYGDEPADSGENNGTDHQGYGRPYGFGPHGHHPYSSFPYGNHGPFYGPYGRNNSSENGRNRPYGPYYDGPDFYGPPGYGHHHGHGNGNNNNNNNNNSNRQTEEPAENGDENNSTRNGHPHHYGPPLFKPLLGAFHLHGLPSPFNLLPYDHFHGVFKGGPVVGVGHIGYPTYVGPYPIGFPFHHSYGPFFYGKKYLPPKGKPSDSGESGESTEAPAAAGELAENATPERITAGNQEVIAPASSSNRRYKISGQNGRKQISMANSASRKA
ncbi:GATA zinc finger domain-containing protein 14-like [Nylanderia fulva]|uniref:GATA zinc finger domain-containing protein 14-like n=1 Tax=Nylanderia fulva TaxID=613905 RepID=UPI0010FAD4A0|nr:GATA zinc finger domain-containing protein 14-like [Nylanderia fulva]